MSPKRRYRPRRKRTPGETLLRFLIERGGSATLWEISRHTADGELLAQAAPELSDLIAIEDSRGSRSHRPARRVSLTLKGLAAAQAVRPGWTPRRLATPVLKAWITELQGELDVWAMSLLRDSADAQRWRAHQESVRRKQLVCEPPKPKGRPRGNPFPKGWNRHTARIPGRPDAMPRPLNPRGASLTPDEISAIQAQAPLPWNPPEPATPKSPASDYEDALRIQASLSRFAPGAPMSIRPQPGEMDDSANRAKITKGGYSTAIRGTNRIAFGGQVISFAEFVARMGL
jgi:hypothetical protein